MPLRGGSKKKRDRWFGLDDKYSDFNDFIPWWHREGKMGEDLKSPEDTERAYQEWVALGRPRVK